MREALRGFLEARADRRARVDQDRAGIDRREEVAAEERQQQERQRDEGEEARHEYAAVMQRQRQQAVVGRAHALEAGFEASLEARIKITDTIGLVPFVDMGGAFDSAYPDFKERLRYAAGIGLRYYTAVGPIRLGETKPGKMRKLTKEEVGRLYSAAGL